MRIRLSGPIVLGCVLVAAATGQIRAQNAPSATSQVTFRTSADYVQVSVQARDREGRPVTDLSASDLQIFENDTLQEITSFTRVNVPVERRLPRGAAPAAIAPGETTRVTNVAHADGRVFVLFVDAMHVAPQRTVPMRRLLRQFVLEHMGDNDLAAVVVTGGLTAGQDFTGDKGTLLAAIARVSGDALPSRMLSKWRQRTMMPHGYVLDPFAGERAHRAQQALISLRRVSQMLSGVQGRRTAVLYVSEGLDIDLFDRIGRSFVPHMANLSAGRDSTTESWDNNTMEAHYASQVADELQLTVEASTRSNVAIYTIDPRGLADAGENSIHVAGPIDNAFLPTSIFRAESIRMQQYLRDIAARTGGRAIVNTNYFAAPLDAIVEDASHYYVLAYRTTPSDDGRFHRIQVRTSRPGITLTARDGYYAPRRGTATQATHSPMAALLESPIYLPGLAMSAASTVIPRPGASTVRFVVEFGGSAIGNTTDRPPVIEMAYVISDDGGRVLTRAEKTLTLAVSREMRTSLADQGLRYVAEVAVPPGRHHVRLAAINRATASMGSLFWDIQVPAVPHTDVEVSPLMLTSREADTMPTISDVPQATAGSGNLMTARRAFDVADVLSVSTLVANGRQPGDPLAATFVISAEDGQEMARKDVALPTTDRESELAAFSQYVALEALAPGRYRADFVVRSANGRVRAERAVLFEVTNGVQRTKY